MTFKKLLHRAFPAPLLSLVLCVLWLLLNRSLSAGNILLGAAAGLAIPVLTGGLRPSHPRIRRLFTALRLALRVVADTTRSNLEVTRFLLLPRQRRHPSGFVHIPLTLRDPHGLAVLSMISCITPGTAWAELAMDRSVLLMHVLELDDAAAFAEHIKQRYEQPLVEIFES